MTVLATSRPAETFDKQHGPCDRCGRDRYLRPGTALCRACREFQLVPVPVSDEPAIVWVQSGGVWRQQRRRQACEAASPALFDSIDPLDHLRARKLCAACPFVRDCIETAALTRPEGTWGGLLWVAGEPLPQPLEGPTRH